MKARLIDTHLLVPRSRSSAKVKVKYQGHVSQKMGVSGALVFHKHILFHVEVFNLQLERQPFISKVYGSYSPSICKSIPQFLKDFPNMKVTQLLIGYTILIG